MSVPRSHQPDTEPVLHPCALNFRLASQAERLDPRHEDVTDDRQCRGRSVGAGADCSDDVAPARSSTSRNKAVLPPFAAAFAVRFGGAAAAYECPKHIADTQALIWRVSAQVESQQERMPSDMVRLVHALIDDARMLLGAARHDHEEPQGPFDHARAFAKADAALGHARAAEILCARHAGRRR